VWRRDGRKKNERECVEKEKPQGGDDKALMEDSYQKGKGGETVKNKQQHISGKKVSG
jgi:hypothetical protein